MGAPTSDLRFRGLSNGNVREKERPRMVGWWMVAAARQRKPPKNNSRTLNLQQEKRNTGPAAAVGTKPSLLCVYIYIPRSSDQYSTVAPSVFRLLSLLMLCLLLAILAQQRVATSKASSSRRHPEPGDDPCLCLVLPLPKRKSAPFCRNPQR